MLQKDLKRTLPYIFNYRLWIEDEKQLSVIADSLLNYYLHGKNIGMDTLDELIEVNECLFFKFPYFLHDIRNISFFIRSSLPMVTSLLHQLKRPKFRKNKYTCTFMSIAMYSHTEIQYFFFLRMRAKKIVRISI